MEFIIGLLINLLIIALIVAIIFWVLGMFGLPANIIQIVRAIIALIVLLWLIQILLGNANGFYPVHAYHHP